MRTHSKSQRSRKGMVLLDRDGTLIVDKHYLSDPDGVELVENAAEAIRQFRALGLPVAVVTNQSGLARGHISRRALTAIHSRLRKLLAAERTRLDGIFFCPHDPGDGCACRKPRPGLLRRAARKFRADLERSFVIGDKASDIEAGRRVGATTLLVRTGYGKITAREGRAQADYVVANLAKAATVITRLVGARRGGKGD